MRPMRWLGIVGGLVPGILSAGPGQENPAPAGSPSALQVVEEVQASKPEASPAVTPPQEEQAVSSEATAVVAKLNQTLIEVMRRARELGYAGRYKLLAPVIDEIYDFSSISRYVLGSHWSQLTAEEKEAFVRKMTEYGIATYAAQFDDYSGEQFRILSEEPFRTRFRVVKAILEVPKEENIEFVYILRPTQGGWKIIDVRYDGVSDLALKRGQFADILVKEGFDGLLAKLDEKIANYAKGGKERG